jgi:hypothetical protein
MSITYSDDEQRARERAIAPSLAPAGWVACRGYPADHFCIVLIPEGTGRVLCYGCRRAVKQARAEISGMTPVGRVLDDLPPLEAVTCPCGGLYDGYRHEESLTHIRWLSRG